MFKLTSALQQEIDAELRRCTCGRSPLITYKETVRKAGGPTWTTCSHCIEAERIEGRAALAEGGAK